MSQAWRLPLPAHAGWRGPCFTHRAARPLLARGCSKLQGWVWHSAQLQAQHRPSPNTCLPGAAMPGKQRGKGRPDRPCSCCPQPRQAAACRLVSLLCWPLRAAAVKATAVCKLAIVSRQSACGRRLVTGRLWQQQGCAAAAGAGRRWAASGRSPQHPNPRCLLWLIFFMKARKTTD